MSESTTIELRLEQKALPIAESVGSIKIVDAASFAFAADGLRTIKGMTSEIRSTFAPMKEAAHLAHKRVIETELKLLQPLLDAESAVKNQMVTFEAEQERQRQERERRAREEAARLAREQEERARQARQEAQRKADEERRKLEDEQRSKRAAEEAARRAEEEKLIAEAPSLEAVMEIFEEVPPAAVVVELPPPVVIPEPLPVPIPFVRVESQMPKAKGVSFRETWSAEVVDLRALARAVAEGTAPVQALQPNQKFLDGQAKAFKSELRYPGVEPRVEKIVAAAAGR